MRCSKSPRDQGLADVRESGAKTGDQVGAVILVPVGTLAEMEQGQVQFLGRLGADCFEGQALRVRCCRHQGDHRPAMAAGSGQVGIHTALPCI
ncbi:hypothetical protein AB0L33_33740 [Streptomyces sp. NPDC052299]|uniref:hypothetical protein n=1 Tax=Streptomyces sp. NPDC052299 TaxID=3155054 RepID=UPI0034357BCD